MAKNRKRKEKNKQTTDYIFLGSPQRLNTLKLKLKDMVQQIRCVHSKPTYIVMENIRILGNMTKFAVSLITCLISICSKQFLFILILLKGKKIYACARADEGLMGPKLNIYLFRDPVSISFSRQETGCSLQNASPV